MKNRLNLFFLTACSILILITVSCKNNSPGTDYSKIRVKQIITKYDSYSDTMYIYYSGENIQTVNHYSTEPSFKYTFNYVKNGAKYDYSSLYGATPTHEGFHNFNAKGYIDTARITNMLSATFNNRDRNYYNGSGYQTRSISNYNNYENDVKRYYNADGDYTYWIYDFTHFTIPANSYQDSITFDYYTNELHMPYESATSGKYGKMNKHLVKKRYNYNNTNDVLKSTVEYQYEFDSRGLVTKRTMKRFNQPGNVPSAITIAEYTYEDF